jgi:hypothetical protein
MLLLTSPPEIRMGKLTPEEGPKKDVLADVDIVLSTRIFIADDVEALMVRKKWSELVTHFLGTHDRASFKSSFQTLRVSIVGAAKDTK